MGKGISMELVESKEQLIENSIIFDSYRLSNSNKEQTFYRERLRLGKMFLHIKAQNRNLFCPSRFIGYENNSMQKHLAFRSKTGTKTNQKINSILGRHQINHESEKAFLNYCSEHGVEPANKPREYWVIDFDGVLFENSHPHDTDSDHPDELNEYIEGKSKKVTVNKYERDTKAREKCIQHYGYQCSVCKFSFKNMYGGIGEEFIHVHHLTPISAIGKQYKIDPVNDLRPVCPNCHAMLHKSDPPFSIEELKSLINENRP
jgi:5-methylcytosine-specific restriction protein A